MHFKQEQQSETHLCTIVFFSQYYHTYKQGSEIAERSRQAQMYQPGENLLVLLNLCYNCSRLYQKVCEKKKEKICKIFYFKYLSTKFSEYLQQ